METTITILTTRSQPNRAVPSLCRVDDYCTVPAISATSRTVPLQYRQICKNSAMRTFAQLWSSLATHLNLLKNLRQKHLILETRRAKSRLHRCRQVSKQHYLSPSTAENLPTKHRGMSQQLDDTHNCASTSLAQLSGKPE